MRRIRDCSIDCVREALGGSGLAFSFGCFEFVIRSPLEELAAAIQTLYGDHSYRVAGHFADFHVDVLPGVRLGRRCTYTVINGQIWKTWRRGLSVAGLEWVCNWCFFRSSFENHLALHAAAVEVPSGEGAIIFPGVSGAGKSTLAATLMLSDWRLLSDEVALLDMETSKLMGLGRSIILKAESIDIIGRRFPDLAVFGPSGRTEDPPVTVRHLRPTAKTTAISGHEFDPLAFFMPSRQVGVKPTITRLTRGQVFTAVSQYGLNYRYKGKAGFDIASTLCQACPGFSLVYEEAADAEKLMRELSEEGALIENLERRERLAGGANADSWRGISLDDTGHARRPLSNHPSGLASAKGGNEIACRTVDNALHNQVGDVSLGVDIEDKVKQISGWLQSPQQFATMTEAEWDWVLLLANHLQVLGHLSVALLSVHSRRSIPKRVVQRLDQQIQVAEFTKRNVDFELLHLREIARQVEVAPVLLKGAAYLATGAKCGLGRTTRDVDILVPEESLDKFLAALSASGYSKDPDLTDKHAAYYRKWLHEVPPMLHSYRKFEVDIHFRLLPKCDALSFEVDDMLSRSMLFSGEEVFRVLDRIDQAILAIINLGRSGEFLRAFRDTWDLFCIIDGNEPSSNGQSSAFDWNEFSQRVIGLRLGLVASRVLELSSELHQLAVPDDVIESLAGMSRERLRRNAIYRLMRAAALPGGSLLFSRKRMFALWALEYYPGPKPRTWLDPLTWTKRISFLRDA